MTNDHENRAQSERDPRLDRLAAELRERGQAPERDLWPQIDAAISAAEAQQLRPRRARRPAWGQWAAAAAVAALLVVGGWWAAKGPTGPETAPSPLAAIPDTGNQVALGDGATDKPDELSAIDTALDEVNLALAADPESRSLTNLAVMLHRTRGRVLRQSDAMHITGS